MPADLAPQGDGATPTVPLLGGATPRRLRFRYFWLIGVVIYLAAVWYVGWDEFGAALATVHAPRLAWVGFAVGAALGLRVLKWRLILGRGSDAVQLYFLSKIGGGLSPGRIGELSPLLLRKHRTPQMAAWIVADRLLETAATLAFGAFGLLLLKTPLAGLLPGVLIAACLFVGLPLVIVTQQGIFAWMAQRTAEHSIWHRAAEFLEDASGEIVRLKGRLPLAAIFTIIATALDIWSGLLAYWSMGSVLPFALLAAVQCVHGLVAAIPLFPNATGVPYVADAMLVNRIGGVGFDVIAATVTVHTVIVGTVFWGTFGLMMWLPRGDRET
jgi:hypothetical protein